jgi:hypothetical protein
MERNEEVYLDMESWGKDEQKLGEMFNGKTLAYIKDCLCNVDASVKDNLIVLLLELAVNLQDNNERNHRILGSLLTGEEF